MGFFSAGVQDETLHALFGLQELPLDHTRAHVNEHMWPIKESSCMLLVHSMANLPSEVMQTSPVPNTWEFMQEADCIVVYPAL